VDLSRYGLPKEPVVSERIALGADIVTFSGDKVLGGPQAGVVVGKAALVKQIGRNPLHRAVRCGKLTIAALEATLRLYRESASITEEIPTLKAFARPLADVEDTARRALPSLASALGPDFHLSVQDSTSQMGSGALPTDEIPTKVIVVEHDSMGAHRIADRFRQARPPIIGRVNDDRFILDARTIYDPLDLVPNWTAGLVDVVPRQL
jgi:L-seryl-tRNA(Ser) seleniumtransferase